MQKKIQSQNPAKSLNWIIYLLVLSLPFERIPSISLGGANLRISQVLILISIALWAKLNWNKPLQPVPIVGVFGLLFFTFGLGSWLNITELPRFLITIFGTALVFVGSYLISRAKINVWRAMQDLVLVMFGVGLFAYYQFIGDMIGLSVELTGLREQYTKIVFGIPRVHATAIEPLYFAGMLMIPITILIISLLYSQSVTINQSLINYLGRFKRLSSVTEFLNKLNQDNANSSLQWGLLAFFFILFVLTLSKGAWAFTAITLLGIFLMRFRIIFEFFSKIFSRFRFQIGFGFSVLALIGVVAWVTVPTIAAVVENFGGHIAATLVGESGTIAERQSFVTDAWTLLENNPIFGIGSGHYGVGVKDLGRGATDGGYLITNNVYLEVWLEHGALSFLIFIAFLIYPLIRLLELINKQEHPYSVTALMLFWILIGYYLQWTTFSPIFIMPIFILLGLAYNLVERSKDLY